jgi:hypothetical protein
MSLPMYVRFVIALAFTMLTPQTTKGPGYKPEAAGLFEKQSGLRPTAFQTTLFKRKKFLS